MFFLKNGDPLLVRIADGSTVYAAYNAQLDPGPSGRQGGVWHEHETELIATPLDILELPQDLLDQYHAETNELPTVSDYTHWYYLKRRIKLNGRPEEYIARADDLIAVNYKYPTKITMPFLKRVQENLALAQLEAIKLSNQSEIRVGTADRLLNYLRQVVVAEDLKY